MPSFDVVSEVDMHELDNALDNANREVGTRFDFKGADAKFERTETVVLMQAEAEFQLGQMLDILQAKMAKRNIDVGCLDIKEPEASGKRVKQEVHVRQGIEVVLAKKMVKMVKEAKMKVQAAIQGEKLRITGKKRDDLQAVMALFKGADLGVPLQYENFRD